MNFKNNTITYPTKIVITNGEKFSIEYQRSWTESGATDWPYFWRNKKVLKTEWKPMYEGDDPFSGQYLKSSNKFPGTWDLINRNRLIFDTKESAAEWLKNWNKKFEIPKEEVGIEVK